MCGVRHTVVICDYNDMAKRTLKLLTILVNLLTVTCLHEITRLALIGY
jgi:hypothetical protein